MLTRRELIAGAPAALARGFQRPNVLVFLSDQESAILPGPVRLPNRRRLIERGVEFTQTFCNTPQCSAARSSLLTGLEPHRSGVWTNVDGSSLGKPLSPSLPTAGSVFRKAGYSTGYFGKWHLGGDEKGLDLFGFSVYERGSDDAEARKAARWIGEQSNPWLAWVSVLNPHDIYRIPKVKDDVRIRPDVRPPVSGLADLRGKPAEQMWFVEEDQGRQTHGFSRDDWLRYRSYYLELVEQVDRCLGTVLGAVKDLGNTIVAYTSDHGDALGEHGLPYKGPFMYEELVRIPLIISAPGEFSHRQQRDDPAVSVDLAPTLAALAGLEWPGTVAGRSLVRPDARRDAVFLEYYAKQKSVNPIRTIRTRRWKFNWYDRGNKELYDLAADPRELHNRAGDTSLRPVQSDLEARLSAWRGPLL